MSVCVLLFYFFFQAEDGIRDGTVTGVQTCALPILGHPERGLVAAIAGGNLVKPVQRPVEAIELWPLEARIGSGVVIAMRSEERRVGKSVDLGGRSIKKKKKKKEK